MIDFGSAAYISSGPFTTFFGTKLFASPEVLEGLSYEGPAQDVWQLGILLYTLAYRENPFYNVQSILNCSIEVDERDAWSGLLRGLLNRDPETRITIEDALGNPWLNNKPIAS